MIRLKGETLVSPSGFGVVVMTACFDDPRCEVMVVQDPSGEFAVGGVHFWTEDLLSRLSPGAVVALPEPHSAAV